MALLNCPECDKQISDKADMCPGCGAPVTTDERQFAQTVAGYRKVAGVLFFGPLLYLVFAAWISGAEDMASAFHWARWIMAAGALYYICCEIVRNLAERKIKKAMKGRN